MEDFLGTKITTENIDICSTCNTEIELENNMNVGDKVTCPYCGAEYIIKCIDDYFMLDYL